MTKPFNQSPDELSSEQKENIKIMTEKLVSQIAMKSIAHNGGDIKSDIQNDVTTLSYQQGLVLQQHRSVLSQIERAYETLDNKVLSLLQSASLIFSLIGVLEFPKVMRDPTPLVVIGVIVAFIAFGLMVYFLVRAWYPSAYIYPCTQNWDEVWDKYLLVGSKECFTQVLADYLNAGRKINTINDIKSANIKRAIWLFLAQIVVLVGIAIYG